MKRTLLIAMAVICTLSMGYAQTDANGDFVFYNLLPGDYTIFVGQRRYESIRESTAFGASDQVLPTIVLNPRTRIFAEPLPVGDIELRWLHQENTT